MMRFTFFEPIEYHINNENTYNVLSNFGGMYMSDNLADAFSNFKKMVDSGNIPSEIQGLVNNLNNGNGNSQETLNNMLSQVSPEMLNNFSSILQSNNSKKQNSNPSNSNYNSSNNGMNIDAETLMRMTSIINKMNQKDNPGNNLLHSLKPYLRDSRKSKLDQYANLLNITRIADAMKKENNDA